MIWLVAAGALFAAIILMRLLMLRTARNLLTTHLQLLVPDLHPALESLRFVFLTDLHVGRMHVSRDRLLAALEAAAPDVLLLGGDYSAEREDQPRALKLVEALCAGRPSFGVAGNSDHHQGLDLQALRGILRASGGDLLLNEVGAFKVGAATVAFLGVDDPLRSGADVAGTAARAANHADLRIGLCHSPALWQELPLLGAQITLLGHSHGGQIRAPGLEAHFTHATYPRRLAAGLFRYREEGELPQRLLGHSDLLRARGPLRVSTAGGALMYVSRGIGMGVIPARICCPPEMVLIELMRDDSTGGDGDGR